VSHPGPYPAGSGLSRPIESTERGTPMDAKPVVLGLWAVKIHFVNAYAGSPGR